MKIFGLAGWSNSGKTTLLARLIPALIAQGVSVSTIKHAHHDFDVDTPGKDSHTHRISGAHEVLVASAARWALMHEHRGAPEPPLAALLAKLAPVDLVLIEGFKRDRHPKLEVFRAVNARKLLQPDDPDILAVATDGPLDIPVPVLDARRCRGDRPLRPGPRRVTPALVVLAGGRGSRMGGADKALLPLAGRPLLAHVLARLAHDGPRAISANGDPARFAAFGLPVLADTRPDFPGPLAGILAAMAWSPTPDVVTVPVDAPFLPPDLVARLCAGRGRAAIAMAASAGRTHPVAALWPTWLRAELAAALDAGQGQVRAFAMRFGVATVDFPTDARDPFVNLNTPADLAAASH